MGQTISIPFRFVNGSVAAVSDDPSIWKDRVFIAVTTQFGERLMSPTYGTDVQRSVFESATRVNDIVKKSVASAFSSWLPELSLMSVSTTYDPQTSTATTTINYRLPTQQEQTLTFNVGTFDRYGTLIQG